MYKAFISLIFVLVLTGCVTTANYQQTLNQWYGAQIQDLINVWGYPDSSLKLPNGDTVYMYVHKQLYTSPMYPTPMFTPVGVPIYSGGFYNTVGTQTVSLYCRTWFEVNKKGVIVNTQFEGNNCVANRYGH